MKLSLIVETYTKRHYCLGCKIDWLHKMCSIIPIFKIVACATVEFLFTKHPCNKMIRLQMLNMRYLDYLTAAVEM